MEKEHRQRLQKLYLKLLENITDYKGIVAGLFAENILTAAMKERVEKESGTDQLRVLLDILPKRGDRAFHAFYQVLVERDESTAADLLCPELAGERQSKAAQKPVISGVREITQPSLPDDEELPTKWPDQTSHDPFRVDVAKVADQDRGMKALFDKGVAGSGTAYAMHKPTRGIFLLISNEYFKEARSNGEDLDDRAGTGKDTIALTNLFKQLHFRVVAKVNLTADEMLAAVRQQADKVEATDNCFACAVLTHGERGLVFGVDGKMVALDDLKAAVADNCQMLIGKPKIFFIQACQGKKMDSGAAATGGQGEGDVLSNPQKNESIQELAKKFAGINIRDETKCDAASEGRVSSKSDIFVAMATVADFVSWRNTNWGTWFVQAVTYIFSRFAHKYEINQLMIRVNKLVGRAETSKGYKQVSIYSSSLTSEFYFFPGLQHGMVESHSEVDVNISSVPSQTASVEPRQTTATQPAADSFSIVSQPSTATQPAAESGSIVSHPSDGVDGERSVLVE